jgi:hypothetical protein
LQAAPRFALALAQVDMHRMTDKELIGKGENL